MSKAAGTVTSPVTTREYITAHAYDDVRRLALRTAGTQGVDMPYALSQIAAWQIARHKLPTWAATEGIVWPRRLSMEQCSSEPTARYKAYVAERLLSDGASTHKEATSFVDLTGGLGVDFSFMARHFDHSVYVEHDSDLCSVAATNFPLLRIDNAEIVCSDAADYLRRMASVDIIYLDPARRTGDKKVVALANCSPDIGTLMPLLLRKSRVVMMKLSPMLDWHKAVADLGDAVEEVHMVEWEGECKELLITTGQHTSANHNDIKVSCVSCQHDTFKTFSFRASEATGSKPHICNNPYVAKYLYEPAPTIMKAGCFSLLSERFHLAQVARNSHLFVSDEKIDTFPGRILTVMAVCRMSKTSLRENLRGIDSADISVRNFPMTAEALRARLRLKDGGDIRLLATTTDDGQPLLFITHKEVT